MAPAPTTRKPAGSARVASLAALVLLLALALLPSAADALHFYLLGAEQKCFTEDLPKGTTVHGDYRLEDGTGGHANAPKNAALSIQVIIEELPQRHRILNQRGQHEGKFAFTSSESGEHAICLSTNATSWFSSHSTRVYFDLHIGDAEVFEDDHKDAVHDLVFRVRELNSRANDIKREQFYQKENEAKFRDVSELANSRVVYWTIVQLFVIVITGVWQMRHLKGFFTAKKLV